MIASKNGGESFAGRMSQVRFALRSISLAAILSVAVLSPAAARDISFSGRSWAVTAGPMDDPAAPNRFSGDVRSVWVDGGGRLHLRVRRNAQTWDSAEIACSRPLGYGTYSFALETDVGALDPNVVIGLFTWSDDDAFADREIDIEFSRWGDPAAADAQFAIQPYALRGHLVRFNVPRGIRRSTYSFRWEPASVAFAGYAAAILSAAVPPPGDARVHINIWLAGARAPIDRREAELVVDRFNFTAMDAFIVGGQATLAHNVVPTFMVGQGGTR